MANFEEQQKFAVQYKLSSKSFGAHQVNLLEKSKVTRHDLETWRKNLPRLFERNAMMFFRVQ